MSDQTPSQQRSVSGTPSSAHAVVGSDTASSEELPPPPFQQTVCYIDWVMSTEGKPVVRIFGSATTGQKSLLHLHGCFPYLYCDIPQGMDEEEFLFDIKVRLDAFLKGGNRPSNRTGVFRTSIERDVTPIYGYATARSVCKIELFDPSDVRRVNTLLASESFRVYNANVGYLLQVMVDLDLAGMDDITCTRYCFRGPLPDPLPEDEHRGFRWSSALKLMDDFIMTADRPPDPMVNWWDHVPRPARTSTCELELDVDVSDVIIIKPDPPVGSLAYKRIKFVKSLSTWWLAEEARRKATGTSDEFDKYETQEEDHVDYRTNVIEDPYEFREVIKSLAESLLSGPSSPSVSTGVASTPVEIRRTKTPYEKGQRILFNMSQASQGSSTPLSQGTKEAMETIERWLKMKNPDEKDDGPNREEELFRSDSFLRSSPSQMTDDEFISQATPPRRTVPVPFPFAAFHADDNEDPKIQHESEDEEIDDDIHGDHDGANVWEAILQSQKQFVESADDDMDGGAMDGEPDEHDHMLSSPPPSSPDHQTLVSPADSVEMTPPEESNKDIEMSSQTFQRLVPPTPDRPLLDPHAIINRIRLSQTGSQTSVIHEGVNAAEHCSGLAARKQSHITIMANKSEMDVEDGVAEMKLKRVKMDDPLDHGSDLRVTEKEVDIKDRVVDAITRTGNHLEPSETKPTLKPSVTVTNNRQTEFALPFESPDRPATQSKLCGQRNVVVVAPGVAPRPRTEGHMVGLKPVESRKLHYSDPKDVPRRTVDEIRNPHFAAPTSLLASIPPLFPTESTAFRDTYSNRSRTKWLEPSIAAPLPDGFKSSVASLPSSQQCTPISLATDSQHSGMKPPPMRSAVKFTPLRQQSSQLSYASSISRATPGRPSGNIKRVSMRTALEKNPANNQMTLLGFEVLARSRTTAAGREGKGKPFSLLPDPTCDPILAIFFCIRDDDRDEAAGLGRGGTDSFGFLYIKGENTDSLHLEQNNGYTDVIGFGDERALLDGFVSLVQDIDPDVLMGWEMQKESLGYLLQRAKALGDETFPRRLSRVAFGQQDRRHENDAYGNAEHSGFWLPGRHVFNLWRIVREEIKLYTYTIQNVLQQLTGEKLPRYSPAVLCQWWDSPLSRPLLYQHFHARVQAHLKICDHLDIIGRNCELSRLFGMDLFSVLTRGSQFRVEAVLLRVCKGLRFLMLSPTPSQVAAQPAMEGQPLIFEPKSAFYSSPVLVLDFRSLYPSVIIANNICFSTCLGRLKQNQVSSDEPDPFIPGLGCDPGYAPPLPLLNKEDDFGFVSPNGVCFVSKSKREGLLPRMLREILDARVMIKKSVEGVDVEESKKRVADARQFGLKMIANVTYGYTAASFSGRMPCAEVADAIVQTGRACLEFAVKVVHDKEAPWAPAECVYGDTDSLFVHLPGRDLEEARAIGKAISDAVSKALPSPMKLQFEKVFHPCVLEVKKRYVGWKWAATKPPEGHSDKPSLDAKGIETIRRDGCPAVVKTMDLVLREIFTSRDLSKVKNLLRRQFDKMFAGTVSLHDFILSGKVKLGSYAKDRKNTGNYPPAAVVADKMLRRDPRAKPVYKERVCYVVACGPPGSRLIDLVVDPHELIVRNLRVNVAHYLFKLVLPALDRLLACAGVDVKSWFSFDKTKNLWGGWRRRLNSSSVNSSMIHHFFDVAPCVLCARPSRTETPGLCSECGSDMQRARMAIEVLSLKSEQRAAASLNTCARCVGRQRGRMCVSWMGLVGAGEQCLNTDCEAFFTRRRAMDRVVYDVQTLQAAGVLPQGLDTDDQDVVYL